MRKNGGSALYDYIVPTLVVGVIAGLALHHLYTSGNLLNFVAFSGGMSVDKPNKTLVVGTLQNSTNSSIIASSARNIKTTCNNTKCDIDYGPFVLKGIPSDNSLFTETVGSPGVTSDQTGVFASVLEQIADVTHNNNPEASKLIKLLSLTTNTIAEKEKLMKKYNRKYVSKTTLWIFKSDNGKKMLTTELSSFGYTRIPPANTFASALSSVDNNNTLTFSDPPLPSDLNRKKLLSMQEDELVQYLSKHPEELASVYYGIWNEIQNTSMSPEVKHTVKTTAAEIAKAAGNIRLFDTTRRTGLFKLTKKRYFNVDFNNSTDIATYIQKMQSF